MPIRSIAVLLLAVSGWTQPFAFSGRHGTMPASAQSSNSNHAHSCCPRLHGLYIAQLPIPLPPVNPPCDNRHSCCFGRESSNARFVTASTRIERPDVRVVCSDEIDSATAGNSASSRVLEPGPARLRPPSSIVLRI